VIAIIGGGFTGAMTLANLLRQARGTLEPLHFVLIDNQPTIGKGVAYRTDDARHLLNVPVEKMSAWPDCPGDFLKFAQAHDGSIKPGAFLPRKLYGQYVRQQLFDLAELAADRVSVELIQDLATTLTPSSNFSQWHIATAAGRALSAELAIVTLGHRPPEEDFSRQWKGPRERFVADPWTMPILGQIGPEEPVLLLGSGLTAVDTILSLDREDRTGRLTVLSRRGLWPQSHASQPKPPVDLSQTAATWLDSSNPLTVRVLLRTLRHHVKLAAGKNVDWRQVTDGLRPFTAKLWARFDLIERKRFLRHGRAFWEIHRHRMAPQVAERLSLLQARNLLDLTAGGLSSAEADDDGVNALLKCRGNAPARNLRVAWVINCTGPGAHTRQTTHPILRPLLDSGVLLGDDLSLGLHTDADGRALSASGVAHANLLIAGTLRKSTLWESTAVPELRQQAAAVAATALRTLAANCCAGEADGHFPCRSTSD
jgi:uncharacterized NAD(P)/FAD-binding protein YdhS